MAGLLERDAPLARLHAALERVRSGPGEVATVSGEAGVGKTSLVRAFTGAVRSASVLWGACDGLRTPRPLGPLRDILGGAETDRDLLFAELVERLAAPSQPVVVVVEDAHWADEATLDVLTLLGRRAPSLRALVLLTYRDDEVGGRHPLRVVLGDLGPTLTERIRLAPLSVESVADLAAGAGVDVDHGALHAATRGNPFFVTESLASGATGLPDSVRDAVLARVARLGPSARRALEAVAVVPGRAELQLVEDVAGSDAAALDECVEGGVVEVDGGYAALRHELARLAVVDAIAPTRRRGLHRRVLAALREPVDHARAAFHAAEAGDVDAVLRHAPAAAERAAATGAHREAVAHLDEAVRHGAALPAGERAALLERLGDERAAVGDFAGSVDAYDGALALVRRLGEARAVARLQLRRANSLTSAAREPEAATAVAEALAIVEPLGPSAELADALRAMTSHHMLARRLDEAVQWAARAEALAADLGAVATVAHIRIQGGVAQLMGGDDAGLDRIHDGIAAAEALGRSDLVALGWSQIGSGAGEIHRYDLAVPALDEGSRYARQHEQLGNEQYLRAWQARCDLDQGRWDEAADTASQLLGNLRTAGIARFTAANALGRLRARRGDPDVWPALDEALVLARQTQHLQRLWPVAASRAEAAWLEDRIADEVDLLREVHELASGLAYPWAVGELEHWLWRAGVLDPSSIDPVDPYRQHAAGRCAEAAEAWRALGCPYESAWALADTGDVPSMRAAYSAFDALGARPAVARLRRSLRAAGERVSRGPNRSARENPAGLTDRELEVLVLLAAGVSNRDLADRLGISTKTAGHHVSHILTKLGAGSRAEAAALARKMGIAGVET